MSFVPSVTLLIWLRWWLSEPFLANVLSFLIKVLLYPLKTFHLIVLIFNDETCLKQLFHQKLLMIFFLIQLPCILLSETNSTSRGRTGWTRKIWLPSLRHSPPAQLWVLLQVLAGTPLTREVFSDHLSLHQESLLVSFTVFITVNKESQFVLPLWLSS